MQTIVFGSAGTTIATLIVLVLVAISFFYTIYALYKYKMPSYMKGLTLLVAMFTVYGVGLMLSGRVIITSWGVTTSNYNYLKNIYVSLLPIFPFYVFTRQRKLNVDMIRFWSLLFILLTILSFFSTKQLFVSEYGKVEFTNNLGYTFLSIIPLLVFWRRNRTVQFLGLAVIMIFILLCFKRGAIIIGTLSILIFLFQTTKESSQRQKLWTIILSIIVLVIGVFFIQNLIETSDYFNRRIEDTLEGKSGRDELFGVFWNHFINESNPFIFIFGNGANATLTISDNYAHNDWLELAINQGILGVVFYLVYWIMFYKSWRRSSFNKEIHLAIGLSLLIYFMKTLFSMSYGGMTLYSNICIGYCMAILSHEENTKQIKMQQC